MSYKIFWHQEALEDLKRLGKAEGLRIVDKMESYLSASPKQLGKALTGKFKGLFRYRMGKYRVIYTVKEEAVTVLVLRVGKRDEIYRLGA